MIHFFIAIETFILKKYIRSNIRSIELNQIDTIKDSGVLGSESEELSLSKHWLHLIEYEADASMSQHLMPR